MSYKYKVKILEQIIYLHMKSCKNLQRIGKMLKIWIERRRKVDLLFQKKSIKYHTKYQEISYMHMENIIIHIKSHKKYLERYENKQNVSKTWTLPYIYPRKHKI